MIEIIERIIEFLEDILSRNSIFESLEIFLLGGSESSREDIIYILDFFYFIHFLKDFPYLITIQIFSRDYMLGCIQRNQSSLNEGFEIGELLILVDFFQQFLLFFRKF